MISAWRNCDTTSFLDFAAMTSSGIGLTRWYCQMTAQSIHKYKPPLSDWLS
jgi:hypothetical protein